MKINPSMFLNRNPRNINSNSIVCAKNMMLDDNGECLVNDVGITNILASIKPRLGTVKLIISAIDCFVIIGTTACFYYNEKTGDVRELINFYKYVPATDGLLVGTYYYNVNNELIIAVGEKAAIDKQLSVINVDRAISTYSTISGAAYNVISPTIPIAKFKATVVKGKSKKGVYHFFIRYNFNKLDSTKWMHLGYPVTIHSMGDAVTLYSIYEVHQSCLSQASDVYSDDSNQADCVVSAQLEFINVEVRQIYKSYDIAVIIDSEEGVTSYKMCTNNIFNDKFIFDASNLVPISIDELIDPPFKINSVSQICTHNGRLYVGDYQEVDLNDVATSYLSNVEISYDVKTINISDAQLFSFTNPKRSLITRLTEKTLIPNELYRFYIHLVEADGTYTNGVKISKLTSGFTYELVNGVGCFRFTPPTTNYTALTSFPVYSIAVRGVTLPAKYVGWFISYAHEDAIALTGLASVNGYCNKDGVQTNSIIDVISSAMFMDDRPNLIGCRVNNIYTMDERKVAFPFLLSTIETKGRGRYNRYPAIKNPAHTTANGKIVTDMNYNPYGVGENKNRGASIRVSLDASVTIADKTADSFAVLQFIKNTEVVNDKPKLISTGYISTTTGQTYTVIPNGAMHAFVSWDTIYTFNDAGCVIHDLEGWDLDYVGSGNAATPIDNSGVKLANADNHNASVLAFPVYSDNLFETKVANLQFKTFMANESRDERSRKNIECKAVTPTMALDMVKYKRSKAEYYPVDYRPVVSDSLLAPITTFTRTLRRSRPIQDESLANNWRMFMANDYKVIAENKGKITNLVSLGTYLLVHCEHSLFLFNGDSTMKTNDKDIQLQMPDIFDMGYIEVFTSQKGYAGLQDSRYSNISGDFGYIFYDRSSLCIYRFDNGKLITMSDDIVWILNYLKPESIVMTFDNVPDRILMCMLVSGVPKLTLSYSTKANAFISMHDYGFTDAWYTKTIGYIMYNNNIAKINRDVVNSDYGDFAINDIYPTYKDTSGRECWSYVDIIHNNIGQQSATETAMILNSVRYVSNKYRMDILPDNTCDLAEVEPYPADYIKAYSDAPGNMLEVDVAISDEGLNPFKDPNKWKQVMYDKGWFTFNHFRFEPLSGEKISDNMRYIYGKYVVVRFIFKNYGTNVRTRLETVDFNVSKYGQ